MRVNSIIPQLAMDWGIVLSAREFLPEGAAARARLAMDAQPASITAVNAGVPSFMLNYVDPEVVRILQAPNEGANILGEKKTGTWTTRTAYFPVAENVGMVSAYGDDNQGGRSGANMNWPNRQSFHFQTVIKYGDLEVDMAAEAKINWISEQQISAAATLDKFMDYVYHFGVAGLVNYGLLNDPNLPAALTPTTKDSTAGTTWGSTGAFASPNEMFNDFQILFNDLVTRSAGRIKSKDAMTFACSPSREAALLSTNSFGLTAMKIIKDAFPNLTIKTSARYTVSGVETAQLIADKFDAKQTGYCAFTEKMRDHRVIPDLSSFKQKKTAGAWGAIIRYPVAFAQMTGI